AHRARLDQRRVGARARLRHGERAAQFPVEQRTHPALLLLLGAPHGDELGIARVGRLVAEDRRRVDRRAEDLVHEPELHLTEPPATHVGRQMGRPEPALLDLLLERVGQPPEGRLVEVERLERVDLVTDEPPHPLELLLELGFSLEVPRHCFLPGRVPNPPSSPKWDPDPIGAVALTLTSTYRSHPEAMANGET